MPYNHRSKNKKKRTDLTGGKVAQVLMLDDGIESLMFNPDDSREVALAVIRFVRRQDVNKANRYRRDLTKLGSCRVEGEIYNDIIEPLLSFLNHECAKKGIVKTPYPLSFLQSQ